MQTINIYTLTSPLHDEQAVNKATEAFLAALGLGHTMKGSRFDDYGGGGLDLIYVRTGGAEGIIKPLLPLLQARSAQPIYLLTSGQNNSLAASMEILAYLRQHDMRGEILHGEADYIRRRVRLLATVEQARRRLRGQRLGVVGQPSDWLIASGIDREAVKQRLGIEFVDIPMEEVLETHAKVTAQSSQTASDAEDMGTEAAAGKHENLVAELAGHAPGGAVRSALPGALHIYQTLKEVVARHRLQGFSIRCFDLLTAVHNTGCVALALLNGEGVTAGCEGDLPSLLSMSVSQALTGLTGFQANPARIHPQSGELLFAHCTIPFNMVGRYELDTHFESGIGVGVRGYMAEGPVTLFKLSGMLDRFFAAEGTLVRSQGEENLCRTQQVIRLDNPEAARYFLTDPIGNHHIILPGHCRALLEEFLHGCLKPR